MIEAKVEQNTGKPIWREQYPTSLLSAEEQARFAGLDWINSEVVRMSEFGVKEVVVGEPARVTMITQERGNLVKRVIPEKEEAITYLSGKSAVTERIIYTNDSSVDFGPAGNSTLERRVVFQKGVSLDARKIQGTINLVEEFLVAINQDRASRQIKQAEKDLLRSLDLDVQDKAVAEFLAANLGKKLEEAAVESGLIQASRGELPGRIRSLADRFEQAGVKFIELRGMRVAYWPEAIRESWTPETDSYTFKEWTQQEPHREISDERGLKQANYGKP